ncbi:MAG TPA: hypothetical protein VJ981_00505 [Gammaproteobacteria bacterium]|nr:hypothetical protein [Gammaproteobacteria bacterium]
MATEKQNNRSFEDYLQGESGLSRQYRQGPRAEPPKHLDDSIIAAGRNAVKTPVSNVSRLVPRSWYKPVTRVALLVICVSVVFTVYQEAGQEILSGFDNELFIPEQEPLAAGKGRVQLSPGNSGRQLQYEDKTAAPAGATGAPAATPMRKPEQGGIEDNVIQGKQTLETTPAASAEENRQAPSSLNKPALLKRESVPMDASGSADSASGDVLQEKAETDWLAEISELWRNGKKEEAISRLEQFLEAYPDYPREDMLEQLPDNLDPSLYTRKSEN